MCFEHHRCFNVRFSLIWRTRLQGLTLSDHCLQHILHGEVSCCRTQQVEQGFLCCQFQSDGCGPSKIIWGKIKTPSWYDGCKRKGSGTTTSNVAKEANASAWRKVKASFPAILDPPTTIACISERMIIFKLFFVADLW